MITLQKATDRSNLTPLSSRRADLRKAVEEAEWLGDYERLEAAEDELWLVEDKISKGYLYEPNF